MRPVGVSSKTNVVADIFISEAVISEDSYVLVIIEECYCLHS